ncbi:hypothetical protein HU200_056592 [Digitaria exilis]|uniref:Uncharacterized protein n=1 Tax=Digitaria exilis TaxID=1010633 RepID=A0A835AGT3_9POAL|nr:hypothetical protein HU200_056592 [Digitaria exilis]
MERLPKCARDKLQSLSLVATSMMGNLPVWLGNLSRLEVLGVSNNHLSGTVPLGLGALTNLSMLYLDNNNLSGVITEDHLANLRNLIIIDLSYTSLKISVGSAWTPPFRLLRAELTGCQLGPGFPTLFRQQKGISYLDISNTGIADAIPSWFWEQISYASTVDMSQNQIDGELPEKIEAMTWQSSDISRNSISGPLPSKFQAPELQALVLFSNSITGSVPQSICDSRNMAILDLSNNLLVGELPRCMPTEMKISTLLLSNNSLSGEFPTLLRNNTNIAFLDLAKNNFHGNLPGWVGDLSALVIFRIRSNMFSGHIPSEITKLENLHFLDLAHNNISGMIPQSLASLIGMTSKTSARFGEFMDFEWFHDSLSVTIKGRELPYDTQLVYMVSIDLSSNNLDGNVPEEVGSLVGLINLNLSFNHLTGNIPYQIGTLQLLESLDLSHNQLSGEIPGTLSNLTSLGDLNLSYNSLTGSIPSGPQLDTLHTDDPASMYIGNPGLCGYPLPNNCTVNSPFREDNEDRSTEMYLLLGMLVGFVAGLWLVFCAFLFKKRWRITYFRLFDDLYDQVYVFVTVTLATTLKSGRT